MLYFSQFLRQQRLSGGLTMQTLALRLGVTPQYISLLESGHRNPSREIVGKVAAEFGADPNYVDFLAQPIPEAQKRAVLDSALAPDYLPTSLRPNVIAQDDSDKLTRRLLDLPGLPDFETDTPYHFSEDATVQERDLEFPRELIRRFHQYPEDYPPKTRAWADLHAAYYQRHLGGRLSAREAFQEVHGRLHRETAAVYPQKLRYLVALQLALCEQEGGDLQTAASLLAEAHECAATMEDEAAQACTLWLLASLHRQQGDVIAMMDALNRTLASKDIPSFGLARCLSEAVEGQLALWENAEAIERAEAARALWRSSTLEAPQEMKSLNLARMEMAAFEACLRLDRDSEAAKWLSRLRSMLVRLSLPDEENARLAVLTADLLAGRRRHAQARHHLHEALSLAPPGSDERHRLRAAALAQLAEIAVKEGRLADAENALRQGDEVPSLICQAHELYRQARTALVRCDLLRAQRRFEEADRAIEAVKQELVHATGTDPRLADTPLIAHVRHQIEQCRASASER